MCLRGDGGDYESSRTFVRKRGQWWCIGRNVVLVCAENVCCRTFAWPMTEVILWVALSFVAREHVFRRKGFYVAIQMAIIMAL